MNIFKILKLIFGSLSGVLSVLLLLYLALKNDGWAILSSDGQVIVNKAAGICLIVIWAVIGALFLLFDFLHRRSNKSR